MPSGENATDQPEFWTRHSIRPTGAIKSRNLSPNGSGRCRCPPQAATHRPVVASQTETHSSSPPTAISRPSRETARLRAPAAGMAATRPRGEPAFAGRGGFRLVLQQARGDSLAGLGGERLQRVLHQAQEFFPIQWELDFPGGRLGLGLCRESKTRAKAHASDDLTLFVRPSPHNASSRRSILFHTSICSTTAGFAGREEHRPFAVFGLR